MTNLESSFENSGHEEQDIDFKAAAQITIRRVLQDLREFRKIFRTTL